MKHPSTREVHAYWNAKRGRRSMPERAEIDPAGMRHALADSFVLNFDPAAGHPFRLAGTRLCALFARDLKGEPLVDLFVADARPQLQTLIAIVAHEAVGIVAGLEQPIVAADAPGILNLELLLLPLATAGRTDARMLGTLAAADGWPAAPWRRGLGLALGSYRFLGRATCTPAPVCLLTGESPRPAFTVYEGGKSARAASASCERQAAPNAPLTLHP